MKIIFFFFLISTSLLKAQIWQPLHIGNNYQTWGVFQYGGIHNYYCNDFSITKDTVLGGKQYFYYNQMILGLQTSPLRYDTLENKIYFYKDSHEVPSFDFNHVNGDTFQVAFPSGNFLCEFYTGSRPLGGKMVDFNRFKINTIPNPIWMTFYKNIGSVNTSYGDLISGIFISGMDTVKFTHDYAPYFANPFIPDTVYSNYFPAQITVKHHYTYFPFSSPGTSVNYIAKVWLEGYYRKGQDSVHNTQYSSWNIESVYKFDIMLQTSYLDSGYVFYYKIFAKDRSVFPHISEFDTSWRNVIYKSPVNSVSDNIQKMTFTLSQNYPNPFNPSTEIQYQISSPGIVNLEVTDMLGKKVAVLINEYKPAGNYNATFNTSNYSLPSGIYFYTLKSGGYSSTKKLIFIK